MVFQKDGHPDPESYLLDDGKSGDLQFAQKDVKFTISL